MTEALYLVYMMSLTFGLVYSFFLENIGLGKIVIFIMSLHMFSFQVFCLIQYSHTHTHTHTHTHSHTHFIWFYNNIHT